MPLFEGGRHPKRCNGDAKVGVFSPENKPLFPIRSVILAYWGGYTYLIGNWVGVCVCGVGALGTGNDELRT